jgi:tRNA(adenine34) deaminase
MCYATMLLSGIRRFVWGYEDVMGGGTGLALETLAPLYRDMEVELVPGVLRGECLELFGVFFSRFSYWQDSLLSNYTLEQLKRKDHGH